MLTARRFIPKISKMNDLKSIIYKSGRSLESSLQCSSILSVENGLVLLPGPSKGSSMEIHSYWYCNDACAG